MAGGFKIKGHQRKYVRIQIKSFGTYEKLVLMRINERVKVPDKPASNNSIANTQIKLFTAVAKLKVNFIEYRVLFQKQKQDI